MECRYELSACRKIREKTDGNIFRNIGPLYYPDRIDYHAWVQFIGRSHYRDSSPQQVIYHKKDNQLDSSNTCLKLS